MIASFSFKMALAAVVLSISQPAASAKTVRFFDPASKTFMTYDTGGPDREERARTRRPARMPAQAAAPVAAPALARPSDVPSVTRRAPGPEFDRQVVDYATEEAPGTIVIDTQQKFLFFIQDDGTAMRYGVGVGKEGFGWSGTVNVGSLQEWPKWFPPADMVKRRPELASYRAQGMAGGEGNPLGARAIYLHDADGKDTL